MTAISNYPGVVSFDPIPAGSTSNSHQTCAQLSLHDRFFSILLTSAVGAVVTGISSGFLIAFVTTWLSWFATLRVLVVGAWYVKRIVCRQSFEGGIGFLKDHLVSKRIRTENGDLRKTGISDPEIVTEEVIGLENRPGYQQIPDEQDHNHLTTEVTSPDAVPPERKGARLVAFQSGPPSFLGWFGWVYATCYFPIVQILWLAANWGEGPSSGTLKLLRALGISVTALGLTLDTKARYAVWLEGRYGNWAGRLFEGVQAFSTITLGAVASVMLVLAVIQMDAPVYFPVIFIIFSLIWLFGSFAIFPPLDGSMAPDTILTFVGGLAMGLFSAVFVSIPVFGLMQSASTDGATLGEYMSCEGVAIWRKFIAVFP